MKIAILTHPLISNYGGILQAYALSTYLKRQGHDVVVLNRQSNLPLLLRLIKSILVALRHPRYYNPKYRHIAKFIKDNICYSAPLSTSGQMSSFIKKNQIDAVIVGSDQVWRHSFAMGYDYNYFLDFVPYEIKKLSYAASFGLSTWSYTQEQTSIIRQLIKRFSAISVREDEGAILCNNYLHTQATHVLDPTLLLNAEDYDNITSPRIVKNNYIFVYWLGSEADKEIVLSKISDKQHTIIDISLRGNRTLVPVEDWLSYIKYADYVVTDSFHGCVFSIIFQKQFSLSSNDSGGNGRLKSLFRMLNVNQTSGHIDYQDVNEKLASWRSISYNYINKALQ